MLLRLSEGCSVNLLQAHRTAIRPIQEATKGKSLVTLKEIWSLFVQAVEGKPLQREDGVTNTARHVRHTTICLVDGLAECDDKPNRDLILLHDIQQRLIARADRTFIWITLMIDLLRDKVEAGASKRELEYSLESRTVDQIFIELLRGRPDGPKTRKLFSILIAATRPLSVKELSNALALTPEHDALVKCRRPFQPRLQNFTALEYDLVYPLKIILGFSANTLSE